MDSKVWEEINSSTMKKIWARKLYDTAVIPLSAKTKTVARIQPSKELGTKAVVSC